MCAYISDQFCCRLDQGEIAKKGMLVAKSDDSEAVVKRELEEAVASLSQLTSGVESLLALANRVTDDTHPPLERGEILAECDRIAVDVDRSKTDRVISFLKTRCMVEEDSGKEEREEKEVEKKDILQAGA